jgi:hypothetical protein
MTIVIFFMRVCVAVCGSVVILTSHEPYNADDDDDISLSDLSPCEHSRQSSAVDVYVIALARLTGALKSVRCNTNKVN